MSLDLQSLKLVNCMIISIALLSLKIKSRSEILLGGDLIVKTLGTLGTIADVRIFFYSKNCVPLIDIATRITTDGR